VCGSSEWLQPAVQSLYGTSAAADGCAPFCKAVHLVQRMSVKQCILCSVWPQCLSCLSPMSDSSLGLEAPMHLSTHAL
jgi:hypothetical protein